MKSNWVRSTTVLVALAGSAMAMQQAQAGCGVPDQAGAQPAVYKGDTRGEFIKTVFGYDLFDPFHGGPFSTAEITGLWKFTFTSDGTGTTGGPPKDAIADSGFVTWHDDGTELMNSRRAAASGSFCMGVWKQTSASGYKLNHWALSWIPSYQPGLTDSWGKTQSGVDELFQYAGPTNITETITLSHDRNHYSGRFTIKVYHPSATSHDVTDYDQNTPPFLINGTISATRVTVN